MRINPLLKDILKPVYSYIRYKNIREFYRLYNKYKKHARYQKIKDLIFLNYKIDVPDFPSFIWQFKEIFIDEIYMFNSKSEQPVIFDCGANIGMSVIYFKKMFPHSKITAFEADPYIASVLVENLHKNGIFDVNIVDKAVWINYDGVEFGSEGADAGSIKLKSNKLKVEIIGLKDFLEREPKVDFLKIDTEGAEYEVLKDCADSLGKVNNIFVEYHSWNNYPQNLGEILNILEINGFRYYIENVSKRKHPLINRNKEQNMDLQLNIFGYRDA